MTRLEILLLRGAAIVALSSCTPSLPGESLGTFDLAMTLEENTCGESAVYTTDGAHLAVELRREDEACYWRIPGQPVMEGTLEDGKCHFTVTTVVASDAPDPVASDPGLVVPDPTKPVVDMSTKPVCQLLQTAEIVTTIALSPATLAPRATPGMPAQGRLGSRWTPPTSSASCRALPRIAPRPWCPQAPSLPCPAGCGTRSAAGSVRASTELGAAHALINLDWVDQH